MSSWSAPVEHADELIHLIVLAVVCPPQQAARLRHLHALLSACGRRQQRQQQRQQFQAAEGGSVAASGATPQPAPCCLSRATSSSKNALPVLLLRGQGGSAGHNVLCYNKILPFLRPEQSIKERAAQVAHVASACLKSGLRELRPLVLAARSRPAVQRRN